jgi:SSS family solute:Na+ symporter
MGMLFQQFLGWDINVSIILAALVVLGYTFLGGLTSSIYNEVLQFFLIVLGFLPLSLLGLKATGWWPGGFWRSRRHSAVLLPICGDLLMASRLCMTSAR